MSANEFTTGPLTLDEMMKIVSLLENPPEAAAIRKALRFYDLPEIEEYLWPGSDALMKTLRGHACREADGAIIAMMRGSRSVLEIGSGFGGMLNRMAAVMPKGATVVSVSAANSAPEHLNEQASLKEACRKLSILGANVQLFIGDSHSQKVVDAVSNYGPYDFVLVNGDEKDWESYSPMGREAFRG